MTYHTNFGRTSVLALMAVVESLNPAIANEGPGQMFVLSSEGDAGYHGIVPLTDDLASALRKGDLAAYSSADLVLAAAVARELDDATANVIGYEDQLAGTAVQLRHEEDGSFHATFTIGVWAHERIIDSEKLAAARDWINGPAMQEPPAPWTVTDFIKSLVPAGLAHTVLRGSDDHLLAGPNGATAQGRITSHRHTGVAARMRAQIASYIAYLRATIGQVGMIANSRGTMIVAT